MLFAFPCCCSSKNASAARRGFKLLSTQKLSTPEGQAQGWNVPFSFFCTFFDELHVCKMFPTNLLAPFLLERWGKHEVHCLEFGWIVCFAWRFFLFVSSPPLFLNRLLLLSSSPGPSTPTSMAAYHPGGFPDNQKLFLDTVFLLRLSPDWTCVWKNSPFPF